MVLTGIEKKLGDFYLSLDKLSFSNPGIYGIIGSNGCGKTTLAKIIAGLVDVDRGTMEPEGLTTREITFLGRKPYMMDDTVLNNLVYPLKLRNIKIDTNKINSFLEKAKLSHRINQKAKSLSSGEQQKLALLRAIIFKPKFIITDEAMTAMDMDSFDLFENIILEEQKKENSIWIIISHQMPHIRRMCNYIIFMYDGKIETKCDTQIFFSENQNQYVRQYLRTFANN